MSSTTFLKNRNIARAVLMATTALVSVMPIAAYAASKEVGGGAVETISTTETFDSVRVGHGGTGAGTLTINGNGTVSSTDAFIGGLDADTGTVTVTGSGASWTNSTNFQVGILGTGTLNVLDGGTVTQNGANLQVNQGDGTSTVHVSDSGSTLNTNIFTIGLGTGGTGTLLIENGGAVNSTDAVLGDNTSLATGIATVTGAGSIWTNTEAMTVGNLGTGTLTIADGGVVNSSSTTATNAVSGIIGSGAGSTGTVTVTGTGSLWANAQDLHIGGAGTGTLNVQNGGSVTVADDVRVGSDGTGTLNIDSGGSVSVVDLMSIGRNAGSTGTTTVSGAGSLLQAGGGLLVGREGTGTLNIDSGGKVSATGLMVLGVSSGGDGTATVSGAGSTLETDSTTLGDSGTGTGTLLIENGGLVNVTNAQLGDAANATGIASVTGAGSILEIANSLKIGNSGTGTLTLTDSGIARVNAGNGTLNLAAVAGSTGTLNIGAAAGDAAAAAGGLFAGTIAFGAGSGTMNLNHTGNIETNSTITSSTGAATINQIAGVTNYTGDGSGFTGTVNITGGTLNVTGSIGSASMSVAGGALNVTGAQAAVTSAVIIGDQGAITLDNGGALSANFIAVGRDGTGTLLIENGSNVSSATDIALGSNVGGTGTGTAIVTGAGSVLTATGFVKIGDEGTGTLTLANGGTLSNSVVRIANVAGSTGTLNIGAAAGSAAAAAGTLNATGLDFRDGTGTLNFNHTDTNYTFGTVITSGAGTATINQIAGVTNLTANSSTFNGTTNISGGLLSVNGALGGTVNVTGGTLGGTGTLSEVVVTNGAISAGNSPGTLTINNDLTLGAGSSLNFELGSPTGTAGVDSDLINVGSDLTLDGTLNVSDAGGFGAGVYRLINYGGNLTDNGLDIGARPADFLASDLTVQTAVANQINLIVGAPSGLSFWDGANLAANSAIDGGSGTWSATNTNWTSTSGTTNGAFNTGVMQIFQGTGGTVTVDNSGGAIATSTMQFAVDGYTVGGDDLTLSGAATVRVGDGTAAGAGYTATLASKLVGTGSLEKTDLGTLVLTGANTYSGGTTVTGGTLIGNTVSLQGDIVNNAALTFDQASAGTYAGVLSGTGALTKAGAGELVLTGNSSAYAGTTNIIAGLLSVNGSLGGVINLSGGTLGGTGTLGDIAIASGATLAPGNSIGTLNVTNITMAAGSTYTVELNDGGFVAGTNNDLLNATGTATINGGTVHVTPVNGTDDGSTYTVGGVYTIITAAGGVTGTFDSNTDDYSFLNFALSYDANNVYLTSSLADFCLAGFTGNQCTTANALEALPSANTLLTAIANLTSGEAAAMDQLSGEIHASAKTALIADSRFAREAALDRLRVALGGPGTNAGQATAETPEGATVWAQGFGAWSCWNSDGNAADMSHNIGGLFMGADAEIANDIYAGLMGGYSRSSISVSDRISSGTVDSYTLGAYAGGAWNAFSLKGGAAYSWNHLDTSRSVAFTGFSDGLSASYNSRTFQAYTEAAYSIEAGNARFEPFANLAYVNLDTGGFTETGGVAALTSASQSSNAVFTTIGLRAETPVTLGETTATLSGGLGWRHAFGDTPTSTHSFAAGGSAFTVAGVPLARDALVLDAGFNVNLSDSATFGLSYNGQLGSGISDHSAKAGFSLKF